MKAKLPANYVNAKQSLAMCTRVDECRKWADKAAALASYGRQMKDEALANMAQRIRDRAVRRGGELLLKQKAGKNRHDSRGIRGGPANRKALATEAGLTPKQAKTMIRVANVEEEQFETLVEAANPATVAELAELGTKRKPIVQDPYRNEYLDWTHAVRHLSALPACGFEVLTTRGPYSVIQLRDECKQALVNLNTWMRALEEATNGKAEATNDAA